MNVHWEVTLGQFSQDKPMACILVKGRKEDGTEVSRTIIVSAADSKTDVFTEHILALPVPLKGG